MFRAKATIDLAALRHNLSRIRALAPGARVMAMVKGNAYGHGMVTIAHSLLDVDYLAVACIDAALALRHSGIVQPILLTSGFHDREEMDLLIEHDIMPLLYHQSQLDLLMEYAKPAFDAVWLKVDTGMHRYGFGVAEAESAWEQLLAMRAVKQVFWVTHLACADVAEHPHVQAQLQAFSALVSNKAGLKSVANSAAILQYPEAQYDIVRPGLMLYGVSPREQGVADADQLQPVMTLSAPIVAKHRLQPGECVGYKAAWTAKRDSVIGVIPVGYGDGYPQEAPEGTPICIRGQVVPLVGRVSMDTITVDLTDFPELDLGDVAILWGLGNPIEQVAAAMKCSPYALLTGVSGRVRRTFVGL